MPINIKLSEMKNLIQILCTKQHSEIAQTRCSIQLLQNRTHDVFVDVKDNPTFVLLVPLKHITEQCLNLMYYLYVDDNGGKNKIDQAKLGQFLDAFGLDDKSKSCQFNSTNCPVAYSLIRYFKSRGIKAEGMMECAQVYKFDSTVELTSPELDNRFEISSIKPEELEEVNRTWQCSSEATKGIIKWSIDNYPTMCIRDKSKGGALACFLLATLYGTINHLFIYPEYRRNGFAKIIIPKYCRMMEPIFGHCLGIVMLENSKSNQLLATLRVQILEYKVILIGTQQLVKHDINPDSVDRFGLNYSKL